MHHPGGLGGPHLELDAEDPDPDGAVLTEVTEDPVAGHVDPLRIEAAGGPGRWRQQSEHHGARARVEVGQAVDGADLDRRIGEIVGQERPSDGLGRPTAGVDAGREAVDAQQRAVRERGDRRDPRPRVAARSGQRGEGGGDVAQHRRRLVELARGDHHGEAVTGVVQEPVQRIVGAHRPRS